MSEPKYQVGDTVIVSFPKDGKKRLVIEGVAKDRYADSHVYRSGNCLFHDSHVEELITPAEPQDAVNSPAHYTAYPGIEVIQLTEHMNFCLGNAVKYCARAGLKDPSKTIEDLKKAVWYIEREISRLEQQS